MKITILTYGSRGDIQPFISLSLGLIARRHTVKLVAPARFRGLVEEHGIQSVPLAGDPVQLSRRLNDSGQNFIRMARELRNHAIEIGLVVFHQTEEACKNADLIIHSLMHSVGAHTLAREMNIPDIHIQFFPMFSGTGDYPNVTIPDLKLRSLNRLTHRLTHRITIWSSRFGFEHVRRRGGLPKRKLYSPFDDDPTRPRTPILCAWSPHVLPASSDWSSNVHLTGYFIDDSYINYQPPLALQRFLKEGEPPVCITFGSMVNREAEKIDRIVRESIRQANNRGIILSGWSNVQNTSSDDLLYLDAVPHQWLFPCCKMVIHHGGAGTTAAGLRAGIPNVVVPFAADQPFWGNRVHMVGAGPRPIPAKKLSVENLTRAILEADDNAVRKRAQVIGHNIRSEDGVGQAIDWIEKYSNEFHRRQL
jgi:sterol 3beta-glucosyltransferase